MEGDYGLEHVGLLGAVNKEEEEWEKWELEQREKWERGEVEEEEWEDEFYPEAANETAVNDEQQQQPSRREKKNKKKAVKTVDDRPKPRSKKQSKDSGVSHAKLSCCSTSD